MGRCAQGFVSARTRLVEPNATGRVHRFARGVWLTDGRCRLLGARRELRRLLPEILKRPNARSDTDLQCKGTGRWGTSNMGTGVWGRRWSRCGALSSSCSGLKTGHSDCKAGGGVYSGCRDQAAGLEAGAGTGSLYLVLVGKIVGPKNWPRASGPVREALASERQIFWPNKVQKLLLFLASPAQFGSPLGRVELRRGP
jgi:hypothetical protein